MSKSTGKGDSKEKGRSQGKPVASQRQEPPQYEEDSDTDDENNSSVMNDRQGANGSQTNAQTLKKEVKNYKKCRKMFFFLTAMVSARD